MTHTTYSDNGLPELWREALSATPAEMVDELRDAWRLQRSDPRRAAQLAERLFKTLLDEPVAPWLALVIAANGRIHSLSNFCGLDPLLEFFDSHRSRLDLPKALTLQIDAAYFGGLVFRRPSHKHISYWADVCLEAVHSEGDVLSRLHAANHLLLYRIWHGDLLGADTLRCQAGALREGTDAPQPRLLCHSMSAMSRRLVLDYEGCQREILAGLRLAERSGLRFWDSHLFMQGALLELSRENLEEAGNWLQRMETAAQPGNHLDRSGYHYLCAWRYMLQDEHPLAQAHAKESARLADLSGAAFPRAVTHMAVAEVYLEQRQRTRALFHIHRARTHAAGMRPNPGMHFARGLTQARLCFKLDLNQRGRKALAHALAIGRQQNYLNFPWWRSSHMATLCERALDADIERDYVLQIIRRRRLRAPPGRQDWYWPLTIAVLGTPSILLDEAPPQLSTGVEKLVIALAALAGRDHWIERSQLTDRLWPDSDGDRAERALDTAVHRLRTALRSEAMVLTRPGAVALNPSLCRVDYQTLLQRLAEPGANDAAQLVDAVARLAELPQPVIDWLPVASLRRRIVRATLPLLSPDDEKSASRLETLAEAAPNHERTWQALIRCYLHQHLPSAAVDAWHRCHDALDKTSGVEPSPETRVLVAHWLPERHSR